MRRISLAIALVGAVAASGCGGSVAGTKDGGDQAGSGNTFKVTVQNGQDGNAVLAIKGGKVFTDDGTISCGLEADGTKLTKCEAVLAKGTAVALKATANQLKVIDPLAVPPTTKPYVFQSWSGSCTGEGDCSFTVTADKYVVASFGLARANHPNFTDSSVHGPAFVAFANGGDTTMKCTDCHGSELQGVGIAVACSMCHSASKVSGFVAMIATPPASGTARNESCGACHATDGAAHQAIYNKFTDGTATGGTTLAGAIGTVTVTANGDGTFKLVVPFTLSKAGTGLTAADYSALGQKRLSWTKYQNGQFLAAGCSLPLPVAGAAGQFTTTCAKAPFDPTDAASPASFLYFYFSDKPPVIPSEGHYFLPDNTISMAKQFGTIDWTSTANADACTRCHGTPYAKHGYRQAVVAGLGDMVACKACHYDNRAGVDFNLAMAYEDPLEMLRIMALPPVGGEPPWTPEVEALYGYTATTMNDTHISHAKEFLYPQSMGTCATCHAGKLDRIFADANFKGEVCKSCHPVNPNVVEDGKHAPKLVIPYHTFDWVTGTIVEADGTRLACSACHNDDVDVTAFGGTNTPGDGIGPSMFGNIVPLFKDIHSGYDKFIYAAGGTKYSAAITSAIDTSTDSGVSYDPATKLLTVKFAMTGVAATTYVKPTVVVSLYGYDTKDFIVGGHGSAPDTKRNLEWAEAASGNSPRLTVTPATATAGNATWTAVADLSSFVTKYGDAAIKRAEIGFLPSVGIDQTKLADNNVNIPNVTPATPNPNYNPSIAVGGVSKTIVLATAAVDDAAYGRNIVDAAKCNKCHEALAVGFHNPSYGSAGVVACRLCHIVGSGGSHLEMQSRSIDSYVHAIHSFQAFDPGDINFADPLAAFKYEHHTGATYPNFTTLNCESCHNAGTYALPDVKKSLPGILSASDTLVGKTRAITPRVTVVTGPGSRACGGCHRAKLINADDAARLDWFDAHSGGDWGYRLTPGNAATLDAKIPTIFP